MWYFYLLKDKTTKTASLSFIKNNSDMTWQQCTNYLPTKKNSQLTNQWLVYIGFSIVTCPPKPIKTLKYYITSSKNHYYPVVSKITVTELLFAHISQKWLKENSNIRIKKITLNIKIQSKMLVYLPLCLKAESNEMFLQKLSIKFAWLSCNSLDEKLECWLKGIRRADWM